VSRDKATVFLQMATALSRLATCDRSHVGAIIIKEGRCISWGYNGAPPGLPHCDESRHGWLEYAHDAVKGDGITSQYDDREKWIELQISLFGCRATTHAEANALAFAARQGISTAGGALFTTVSPCETCAKYLIAAGIKDVHYLREYRDTTGIKLLDKARVYTHYHGD
jgi:dCMP deaminase